MFEKRIEGKNDANMRMNWNDWIGIFDLSYENVKLNTKWVANLIQLYINNGVS